MLMPVAGAEIESVLDERWLTDSARAHPSSKGYPPVHHSGILRAGVGRIYLYDHQSRKPMSDEIQSYIQEGFVKYIPFEGKCRPEQLVAEGVGCDVRQLLAAVRKLRGWQPSAGCISCHARRQPCEMGEGRFCRQPHQIFCHHPGQRLQGEGAGGHCCVASGSGMGLPAQAGSFKYTRLSKLAAQMQGVIALDVWSRSFPLQATSGTLAWNAFAFPFVGGLKLWSPSLPLPPTPRCQCIGLSSVLLRPPSIHWLHRC